MASKNHHTLIAGVVPRLIPADDPDSTIYSDVRKSRGRPEYNGISYQVRVCHDELLLYFIQGHMQQTLSPR
jgi:hypothetical protein